MKKILAFLLAAIFCFSLSACGGGEKSKSVEDMIKEEVRNYAGLEISLNYGAVINSMSYYIDDAGENNNGDSIYYVNGNISVAKNGITYSGKYYATVTHTPTNDSFDVDIEIGDLRS